MEIMIISTIATALMFILIFAMFIKEENVAPIVINLMLVMLNIFVWGISSKDEMELLQNVTTGKVVINIVQLMVVAITVVQFIINILIFCLHAITISEERKKEKANK